MLREVKLLCAGYCRVDRSQFVLGDPVGELVRAPAWMYLLRSDDALMLVDTGMPLECVGNAGYFDDPEDAALIVPEMRAEDGVQQVLARQGVAISDIDALISTHWHFDHAGGNRFFREHPILVHPAELEAARQGAYPPECTDMTLNYRLVEDGHEPMPGVTLVHSPGHTPGHMSVHLRREGQRPILLTIDAAYTRRNWDTNMPGAMVDPELGRKSVTRLREIALADDAAVFFGHDPGQAEEPGWQPLFG